jgi:3-oxoacid CoA-transferase B subunit
MSYKHKICQRAAGEIRDGQVINLGIGIPTLIPGYLDPDITVFIHSENGILGMGRPCTMEEADRNLIDAGGTYVHTQTGASFFDSALSFALVRCGRLDLAVLGALEVSESGDVANWIIPGKHTPGIGGAMELAQKARKLMITTSHTTRDGDPKIKSECTLPVTAPSCVDTIITELAVIDVTPQGLRLREMAREISLEDLQSRTDARLILPEEPLPRF